jgi:erythromycin esterase-like protein
MAAPEWGLPGEVEVVQDALHGSFEELFHRVDAEQFVLLLRGNALVSELFRKPRLERAIGVVYHPHTERQSHYFNAQLNQQFDAVVHIDSTSAVTPLEFKQEAFLEEPPETFPSGM